MTALAMLVGTSCAERQPPWHAPAAAACVTAGAHDPPLVEALPPDASPYLPPTLAGSWSVSRLDSAQPLLREGATLAAILAIAEYEVAGDTVSMWLGDHRLEIKARRDGRERMILVDPGGLLEDAVVEREGAGLVIRAAGITMKLRRRSPDTNASAPLICSPQVLDPKTRCQELKRDELNSWGVTLR